MLRSRCSGAANASTSTRKTRRVWFAPESVTGCLWGSGDAAWSIRPGRVAVLVDPYAVGYYTPADHCLAGDTRYRLSWYGGAVTDTEASDHAEESASREAPPLRTAAANAARTRRKHDRYAKELRAAGWLIIVPEKADQVAKLLFGNDNG